jgi:hypothetical protein
MTVSPGVRVCSLCAARGRRRPVRAAVFPMIVSPMGSCLFCFSPNASAECSTRRRRPLIRGSLHKHGRARMKRSSQNRPPSDRGAPPDQRSAQAVAEVGDVAADLVPPPKPKKERRPGADPGLLRLGRIAGVGGKSWRVTLRTGTGSASNALHDCLLPLEKRDRQERAASCRQLRDLRSRSPFPSLTWSARPRHRKSRNRRRAPTCPNRVLTLWFPQDPR